MDLFNLLKEYGAQGKSIIVNWHHGSKNEMMEEYGEEFQEDRDKITFNLLFFEEKDKV